MKLEERIKITLVQISIEKKKIYVNDEELTMKKSK